MRISRKAAWLTLVATGLLIAGCQTRGRLLPLVDVSHDEEAVPGIKQIRIDNRIGDVTVTAAETDVVQIEAAVRIREDRVDQVEPGSFADHVRVTVDGEKMIIADAHTGQPDERDWAVALTVVVPPGLRVRVHNGVGDVTVAGTTAGVNLETGVGDVDVRGESPGAITISTGTGNATITAAQSNGGIKAKSGVGNVQVRIDGSPDNAGQIVAESGTGDVSLVVSETPLTHDVTLTSGVGDVRLRTPADSPGHYRFTTGVGSIRVNGHADISVNQSGVGSSVDIVVPPGGPTYRLESGTGSIVLE